MKHLWIKIILLLLIIAAGSSILHFLPTSEPKEVGSVSPTGADLLPSSTVISTDQPIPTDTPVPALEIPSTSSPIEATNTPMGCWSEGGSIESYSIGSDLLPSDLEYRVYTPPCYQQDTGRYYPVLYMLHGQTYADDQWDRLGIDETSDALIEAGEMLPIIIVMPRDRIWTQPTENNYGEAIVSELVPHIDAQYRTINHRTYRAIGGLSRGANWAVHIGLTSWDLFGAIGAHSYPVFSTDAPKIPGWLDNIPVEELPRFFLDSGDNDPWIKYTLWFEQHLTDRDIPHEWYQYPGYHVESYWAAHIETYLRWYTQEW